ncbi:MAG: CPBP family intramembrane metalloprotease [Thalassovita sp.]
MSRLSPYAPHRSLVTSTREEADVPRLVIGIVAVEFVFATAIELVDAILASVPQSITNGYYKGDTAVGLLAQLLSYGFLALAVVLVAKIINQRSASSLIGNVFGALHMGRGTLFACLAVFAAIELLPPYYSLEGANSTGFGRWLLVLPFTAAALTVQTASEEIFYRGYIQQQIAARFHAPLVWLVCPNLLFAAAHWNNTAGFNDAMSYVIWAFFFGLAASDLTARTGNLGAAIGFHLANNLYAFTLYSELGREDSGLALYLFPASESLLPPSATQSPILTLGLLTELMVLLVLWLSARVAVRR